MVALVLATWAHPGARAESCSIEGWRWNYKGPPWNGVIINGAVTCERGFINIRGYDVEGDSEKFIGSVVGSIHGYAFKATIFDVFVSPQSLKIKYTIDQPRMGR